MSIYLGIDTSNYTTSVATFGDVYENSRKIIDIKEGMRGIRQSDGVFVHLKELPELFEKLSADMKNVAAIGVSTRPRNVDGSYMPVFLVGESFARVIAKSLCEAVNFQKPKKVLFVGGVASNTLLRKYFEEKIEADTYFASPELSCDNAVGIAEFTRRAFL